jgi:hypothetical protein
VQTMQTTHTHTSSKVQTPLLTAHTHIPVVKCRRSRSARQAYAAALLLFFCCFTAVLLLFYCFTTSQSGDDHGARGKDMLLLYCCFTAALLRNYCGITAALLLYYQPKWRLAWSARRLYARFRSRGPVPSSRSLTSALLLLYFCFTHALRQAIVRTFSFERSST